MADVLLARADGIEGFQRHIVIKRIHADLSEDPKYVQMFLDEARLAASLHHHNIVQVNDIGVEDGKFFFAMEYVHGEDVRNVLVEASQRGERIPFEHVVTIVTGAAAGLHHAHEQRGLDGQPLNIVHRDVSPANILVGYDGAVKVADFGIAFAASRAEQTQSGVLKGKVAYMSPEQCNCDPVDPRSDVFSLGIVLYELCTVRPCFTGDNDFMTMSAIVNGKITPPTKHNRDIPKALEAIIMKALSNKPQDRFQSTDEMRRALEEFAESARLRNSTTALADYMKQQFGAKALPWQVDDEEPEIEMVTNRSGPLVALDGGLRSPGRARTPAVIIGDDLALPLETHGRAAPDPAPRASVPRAIVPAITAKIRVAQRTPSQRWWVIGSLIAVVIGAVSLIAVSRTDDKRGAPRATAAPIVHKPAPVEAPAPPPVETPRRETASAEPSAAPAKKKHHKKVEKKAEEQKPAKKWDPDSLFPK